MLIDALLAAGKHILAVGETGTGKTLNLSAKLLNGLPEDTVPHFMMFSARTSANQTQDIIGELPGGAVCVVGCTCRACARENMGGWGVAA